jgi:chaperonin GroEL
LAAQIVNQAAQATNDIAGDGTTTATVLARAIYREASKSISSGYSPVEVKKGIDKAVKKIKEAITDKSTPITSLEDITNVATISANGDAIIGELITRACDMVGKDGSISIQEARSNDTSLELVEGFRFDSGIVATSFITDQRRGMLKYDDALFLVTDARVETIDDILPALEIAARESKPFIIVAEEIEGQALAALIMNTMRGTMKVAAIKAPRYGEERRNILNDLALSVGAKFLTRESGIPLAQAKLEHFGRAKMVESSKLNTTIVGGKGDLDKMDKRIEELKTLIEETDDISECEKIQERITRLASGIAIIKVGAPTEVEMIEKKHRVEDALEAVRSAQVEGIVAGGGTALLHASLELAEDDALPYEQKVGYQVVRLACQEPIKQMAFNAGLSGDLMVGKVTEVPKKERFKKGVNFTTGYIEDLIQNGIVDPVRVTKAALTNAASAAATLMTTNYAIVEKKDLT